MSHLERNIEEICRGPFILRHPLYHVLHLSLLDTNKKHSGFITNELRAS